MKPYHPQLIAVYLLAFAPFSFSGEVVDRLLANYKKIETVSCRIRRTKSGDQQKVKFLSRVYYTNKDQLHAEGITPVRRRTIADGQHLFQYAEGDPKGFSRPINELSQSMTISLKMVPGTAMNHLLRLAGKSEALHKEADNGQSIGIQLDQSYALLQLDAQERLIALEYYTDASLKTRTARYQYSDFSEVIDGVWVPFRHEAEVNAGKKNFHETVQIDTFTANKPVAASLFIPDSFFDKEVDFVDSFAKIFPE